MDEQDIKMEKLTLRMSIKKTRRGGGGGENTPHFDWRRDAEVGGSSLCRELAPMETHKTKVNAR